MPERVFAVHWPLFLTCCLVAPALGWLIGVLGTALLERTDGSINLAILPFLVLRGATEVGALPFLMLGMPVFAWTARYFGATPRNLSLAGFFANFLTPLVFALQAHYIGSPMLNANSSALAYLVWGLACGCFFASFWGTAAGKLYQRLAPSAD